MVDKLKKIKLNTEEKKTVSSEKSKTDRKKKFKLGKAKYFLIGFGIFIGLIGVISGGLFFLGRPVLVSAKESYSLAQQAYQAGKNQDLPLAADKLSETEKSFEQLSKNYQKLSWLKIIPFAKNYYNDGQSAINAGLNGVQAGKILVDAVEPYADVLGFKGQGSFSGGTAEERIVKIVQTLEKVTPKIDQVAGKLDQAGKELETIDPQRYPEQVKGKNVRSKIENLKTMLDEASKGVVEAKPILEVLPNILGYPDSKDYLVIFQNDGELRATGGFMTAFSILNFESGKVKAEKSDDIYSLDNKFNETIEAPEPIKDYLFGEELETGIKPAYYLRDMNFSPDYKVSMENFEQYYDQLKGEYKVDGIIAVDTYVVKDLIDILGPLEVPGYGKFTTEPDQRCHGVANVICELEYIVDQPLPTQVESRKKDVLGPMIKQLMLKSMSSPKNLWPRLFSTGLRFLKEKHMLLYFKDDKMQNAAESFGAAGRIKEFDGDYLHINDSNFGGAKSNLFTEHQVEQAIEIKEDGTITKTLTIVYKNPEKMDNCNLERKSGLCLNSILRNYLRIYVPQGSQLLESVGSEVEMEVKEGLGKTYFDGFLKVKGEGGRAKLVVKYQLPFKADFDEEYSLLIQKQPGTLGHKYKVVFGDQVEEFDLRTDSRFNFVF